jgi:hypothetical protein
MRENRDKDLIERLNKRKWGEEGGAATGFAKLEE